MNTHISQEHLQMANRCMKRHSTSQKCKSYYNEISPHLSEWLKKQVVAKMWQKFSSAAKPNHLGKVKIESMLHIYQDKLQMDQRFNCKKRKEILQTLGETSITWEWRKSRDNERVLNSNILKLKIFA